MGKTVIIAEKPSVAGNIATALNANKREDGYFEGNNYYVSYAYGHLYNLADTKDYNPEMEKWDIKDYPFIPEQFKYKPIDNPGVRKQIKTIKNLVEKSDVVIAATDGDREGQLLWEEIADNLQIRKPIKRLWITSHTPKDIEKGMNNLIDDMSNLAKAGYCRQHIDWILGINFTVIYTLKANSDTTLKLGRIILSTLKLIFDREVTIANFKSIPFYSLKSTFKLDDEMYIGTYFNSEGNTKLSNKEDLLLIEENIKNKSGIVVKKEGKKATENAPKLFNLTDLQGHITSKFKGFSSEKVLKIMQSLYEKKYLTYPRTASRYLDDTLIDKAKESLYAVVDIPDIDIKNKDCIRFHTDKKVFNSEKVDSHPALMPTYIIPDLNTLTTEERIIYMEVVKRFISQFMPAAVYDTVEIITKVEDYQFITKGKVLISEGWKELYLKKSDQEDMEEDNSDQDENEELITAKNVKQNDKVLTADTEIKEGRTKPPKHYTEKTLLSAMESCGKNIENEEEVLKGYTIGTPATRGETIKKLFECEYIDKNGKNILITDLGAKVIHYFPVKKLLRTDFTGQIEKTLRDIEKGQYDSAEFMSKMKAYIVKNIEEMKKSEIPTIRKPSNIITSCPKCGKNVVENKVAFSCEGTKDKKCNFTLWKENKLLESFGKKLTSTIAKELAEKKQTHIKGLKCKNKAGDTFTTDATLKIYENEETGYWEYKIDFDKKNRKSAKKPLRFKR